MWKAQSLSNRWWSRWRFLAILVIDTHTFSHRLGHRSMQHSIISILHVTNIRLNPWDFVRFLRLHVIMHLFQQFQQCHSKITTVYANKLFYVNLQHKTLLQPVPEVPTSTCTGSHISDDNTPMSGTRFWR